MEICVPQIELWKYTAKAMLGKQEKRKIIHKGEAS